MDEDEINRIYHDLKDFTKLVEPSQVSAGDKLVIGQDDRQDLYELGDSDIDNLRRKLASSTVILTDKKRLKQNVDGSWDLAMKHRRVNGFDPCSNERFGHQKVGGWCSGFLVAPDIIATAGHCINENTQMEHTAYIFGFSVDAAGAPSPSVFPDDHVYFGKELISHRNSKVLGDYAIVRLDKPVTIPDVTPLTIRDSGDLPLQERVGVIGYPSGLPVKIAFGKDTKVFSDDGTWLSANLDTYGGNSGSPVMNENGIVEGILVRGDPDYLINNSCFVSNVAPSSHASEIVTKASVFKDEIP